MGRSARDFKGKKIAIIDDDQEYRQAVVRILTARGFPCSAFGSAADFVRSGSVADSLCVILDIHMQDIDGFALQESICESVYDVPIIFCTGNSDYATRQRALQNGAVGYLVKPVRPNELLGTLESVIGPARVKAYSGDATLNDVFK